MILKQKIKKLLIDIGLLFFVFTLVLNKGVIAMENQVKSLTITELKILNLAYSEFQKKGVSDSAYTVSFESRNEEYIVIFCNSAAPEGFRGNPGPGPSFEVVVDIEKMEVISSQFVR